jgi:ribosomal protein L31
MFQFCLQDYQNPAEIKIFPSQIKKIQQKSTRSNHIQTSISFDSHSFFTDVPILPPKLQESSRNNKYSNPKSKNPTEISQVQPHPDLDFL